MIKVTAFEPNFELWVNPDEISAIEAYNPPTSELLDLSVASVPAHSVIMMKQGKAFRVKETGEQVVALIRQSLMLSPEWFGTTTEVGVE